MEPYLLKKLKTITLEEQEILDGRKNLDTSLYNLRRSMIIDSQKLLTKGALIELRPHTRFIHFPKHTHNYVELVYMCSGSTRHIINGSEILLQEGELLFLSQNAAQEIYPANHNDVAVNFIILPEFFDKALAMIGAEKTLIRDFVIECLRNDTQNINYLHFKVADILPIQNLIENLIWVLLNKQPNKHSLNQTTMGLLFLQLMNVTNTVDIGENHYEEGILLQVYRYIEEHYRDGQLSYLAEELHCDLYWLSRMIKQNTGQTYTALLQEKRLRQAIYLLAHTSLSVTNISLDIGYNNFTYFYKLFKNRHGMSPQQYRASFRII